MITVVYGHSISSRITTQQPYVDNVLSPTTFEHVVSTGTWRSFDMDDDRPGNILTLDDGFKDNNDPMLPILERHDVPAILFVTTGFVDRTHFPVEIDLAQLVLMLDHIEFDGRLLTATSMEEKNAAYRFIRSTIRGESPDFSRAAVERVAHANGVNEIPRSKEDEFLDWDEVAELDRHPLITIGAHSHGHPFLANLSIVQAARDTWLCKKKLECHLRRAVDLFAYPYGNHSFLTRVAVRAAGFRFGFTTTEQSVESWDHTRRFQIPRRPIQSLIAQ